VKRGLPKTLFAAIVGVALALLAIRAAATALALDSGHPERLPKLLRSDPRLELGSAMAALQKSGGSPDALEMNEVERAAVDAPLAEEPFILAGVKSLLEEDNERAERLLEEARRREPRSPVTRTLLLSLYAAAGRTNEAAAEMIVLSRLVPGAADHLVPELARLAQSDRGAGSVARLLRADESLANVLMQHVVSSGADPDLILGLAGYRNEWSGEERAYPPWQVQLVARLVEHGDLQQAKAIWKTLTGNARSVGAVQDSRFNRRSSLPPFGWVLTQSSAGVAEAGQGKGLQVVYYGRADAVLAEQLLTLRPGKRYRVSIQADRGASELDGSLAWKLSCREGDRPLAQIPIQGVGTGAKLFFVHLTVPQGCGTQWLRLVGSSLQVPKEQSAAFRSVQVEPANE
jgi:hypothetical protein